MLIVCKCRMGIKKKKNKNDVKKKQIMKIQTNHIAHMTEKIFNVSQLYGVLYI